MTSTEYFGWVRLHCEATGANVDASASLSSAVVRQCFAGLGATAGELGECTTRLIAGLRVPKFPSEHAESVLRELTFLRSERASDAAPDHSDAYYDSPRCGLCGGDGLVAVPIPQCVRYGRLLPRPGSRAVEIGAVLCDAAECARGREAQVKESAREKPRPSYGAYCRRFGGLDLVGMLAAHERERMTEVRRMPYFDASGVEAAMRKLAKTVRSQAEATAGVEL